MDLPLLLLLPAVVVAQEGSFESRIDVERVLTSVRVVDGRGAAIEGLTAADFRVTIGGRRVEVEAADWVEGPTRLVTEPDVVSPGTQEVRLEEQGRLIVLLFQIDFVASRVTGTYRMSRRAKRMLDELEPDDRVAIAVFRTHLQLHSDFSTDRGALADALEVGHLLDNRSATASTAGPSIARHLDGERARDAANLRQGLAVLGDALLPIDGSKAVVLFGYGLGRGSGGGVSLGRDYQLARARLLAARATVFSLDVTDADWHTLELGLREVAEATGGFYQRTHLFPGIAMNKLEGALTGEYELTLIPPDLPAGRHDLDVRVERSGVEVHARPSVNLAPRG